MKKVTFLSLWFLLFSGILTGAAQTPTLPLSITATQYNVQLQSSTDAVSGTVTSKGFRYRLRGESAWTSAAVTGAFEKEFVLPTNRWEFQAFAEVSGLGTIYSSPQYIMVVCDCNIPAPDPCELVDCSPISNGRLTTFTNVMYDFQHQQLEAYVTSGGQPTQYEWFVKKQGASDASLVPIAGAPNAAFFTVPADFMYDYSDLEKTNTAQTPDGSNSAVELTIRCVMGNPNTPTPVSADLDILFIRTNTAGYSTINGVRSLTVQRGLNGVMRGGTINVALLNLGQSEGDNAGDLGDFYQWGRIADGHQHTVWSKDPSTRENIITPFDGNGATSAIIARDVTAQAINSQGQVTGVDYVGNFITNSGDWGTDASGNSDLWGNASNARAGAPISFDGASPTWTTRAQANNVCPQGWRVPSRFEFSDMHTDNGAGTSGTSGSLPVAIPDANNNWRWRGVQTNTNAIGGVIITNDSGENLFLPAAGIRSNSDGTLYVAGTLSYYWSSTFIIPTSSAHVLAFDSGIVSANNGSTIFRAVGLSVRCVAE